MSKIQARRAKQGQSAGPVVVRKRSLGKGRQEQAEESLSEKLECAARLLICGMDDDSAPENYRKGFGTAAEGLLATFPGVQVTTERAEVLIRRHGETQASLQSAEAQAQAVDGWRLAQACLNDPAWAELARLDPGKFHRLAREAHETALGFFEACHGVVPKREAHRPAEMNVERDARIYRCWLQARSAKWKDLQSKLIAAGGELLSGSTLRGILKKEELREIRLLKAYLGSIFCAEKSV